MISDFVSSGWSIFVAAVTIIGILACVLLLVGASKRKVMAEDNSTGHVWDETLREMNNPLPRWWVGLFWVTIIFSVLYLYLYPGLGSYPGSLNWSSTGLWDAEQAAAEKSMKPVYAAFAGKSAEALAKDGKAMAIGQRLFLNNCAQCHGSDGKGSKGFPNLADGDWLGGTGPDYIAKTIVEGRQGVMPPQAAAVGTPEDVKNVAQYVLSLSGAKHDAAAAELGKEKFVVCAACHGVDGKGMHALGSANLTDNIWLHGAGEKAIMDMVNNGKTNIMPAQGKLLTTEQVQVLSAYVWNLSQNTKVAAQ